MNVRVGKWGDGKEREEKIFHLTNQKKSKKLKERLIWPFNFRISSRCGYNYECVMEWNDRLVSFKWPMVNDNNNNNNIDLFEKISLRKKMMMIFNIEFDRSIDWSVNLSLLLVYLNSLKILKVHFISNEFIFLHFQRDKVQSSNQKFIHFWERKWTKKRAGEKEFFFINTIFTHIQVFVNRRRRKLFVFGSSFSFLISL